MKVCHFTSVHRSNDIRIFHKECSSLANNDFEVYLVASNTDNYELNGVHVVNATHKKRKRLARMLFTTREVYQKALEINADVYHFHDPELLPFALKLKRKGKIVIYDAHEDVPKQVMDKHWIPMLMRKFISKLISAYEGYVAKRIDAIVSVNLPICKRFEQYNSNVNMIANYPLYNEIEALREVEIKKIEGQLCYIGGLFPTRGIKQLVQALEFTDAKMVLAGTFSNPDFEQEVKLLPGWSKVDYRGHVDRAEIIEILSSSSIGMVTLLPTASYIESLPIKLFEYMASGIPIVGSNFELWKDIIEKDSCGICVDPTDPKSIASAVNKILKDPQGAELMGENGRRLVKEKYNWMAEEKKLIKMYNQFKT